VLLKLRDIFIIGHAVESELKEEDKAYRKP
jgi:hypothetical protein